jgi:hypothetical protein
MSERSTLSEPKGSEKRSSPIKIMSLETVIISCQNLSQQTFKLRREMCQKKALFERVLSLPPLVIWKYRL